MSLFSRPSITSIFIVLFSVSASPRPSLSRIPFRILGQAQTIQFPSSDSFLLGSHFGFLGSESPECSGSFVSPFTSQTPSSRPLVGRVEGGLTGVTTSSAASASASSYPGVSFVIRMPLGAVGFSSASEWAPGLVLFWSNSLKVGRVAARPVPAEVIDFVAVRYITLSENIGYPMSGRVPTSPVDTSISSGLLGCNPVPASGYGVYLHPDHKILDGVVLELPHADKDMEIVTTGPTAGKGYDAVTGTLY